MSGLVTALGPKRSATSFLAMLGKVSLLLVPEKSPPVRLMRAVRGAGNSGGLM